MGFGGSVQAMIDSLKANRRNRPSMQRDLSEILSKRKLRIETKEIEKLSVKTQQHIQAKIVFYETERRALLHKRILLSALILVVLVALSAYGISLLQEAPDYFFHGKSNYQKAF